jgi:hypothetical protein
MMPRPPSWTRIMMTTWPKSVNAVWVSRTVRPVMQAALVAVNRASRNDSGAPFAAAGNDRKIAPRVAMPAKVPRISTAGRLRKAWTRSPNSGPRASRTRRTVSW